MNNKAKSEAVEKKKKEDIVELLLHKDQLTSRVLDIRDALEAIKQCVVTAAEEIERLRIENARLKRCIRQMNAKRA